MKNKLLLLFLFVTFQITAQQQFTGKVVSGVHALGGVLAVNIDKEQEVKTDKSGFFTISADAGDTIMITDAGITAVTLIVTNNFFKEVQMIEVVLNSAYELEEVVIESNKKITAEGLRIVPKGIAKYTPAERKTEAGRRLVRPEQGLVINTDAVINIFTGKRKALKKALQTERNEQYLEVLTLNYDEETIEKKFSIPKENAMGFLYYAVGDQEVIAAIKAKNPTLTEALMAELALKYLELLSEE